MISGRISKLVSKVASFFGRKPRIQEYREFNVDIPWMAAPIMRQRRINRTRHRGLGASPLMRKVRRVESQRRLWARKRRTMSALLPPPSGQRRAEFSSSVPGQWTRVLILILALILPSLASAQSQVNLKPAQTVVYSYPTTPVLSLEPWWNAEMRPPSSVFVLARCVRKMTDGASSWCVDYERVDLRGPSWAIIGGNLGDAISTETALRNPRFREGNPIAGQSRAQRITVKAAGTVFQVWMVRQISKDHPKLAKVFGYSAGAFFGGVTIHNLRVSR